MANINNAGFSDEERRLRNRLIELNIRQKHVAAIVENKKALKGLRTILVDVARPLSSIGSRHLCCSSGRVSKLYQQSALCLQLLNAGSFFQIDLSQVIIVFEL